jgi:dTDP-4-dehydrorhamnose reductase
MTNKKILVTGSNGQLGKELQQLSSSRPEYEFVFMSKEELPVDNAGLLKDSFKKHLPKYCINCAAHTAVDTAESEQQLAFQINAEAVGAMAAACKEHDCHFIHVSTDYVFDGKASKPYREDFPTNPQSVYGASKLEGERLALEFNPAAIIIRTAWVYSEFGKNFVKTMLRLMSERQEINVVNDQVGSPTYAADLAGAILQIITQLGSTGKSPANGGIYNYTNSGIISWYDFAFAIKKISASSCKVNPIPTTQYPTPAKRPAYSVLDKSKIQHDFGIALKDWQESLEVCMERLKESR